MLKSLFRGLVAGLKGELLLWAIFLALAGIISIIAGISSIISNLN